MKNDQKKNSFNQEKNNENLHLVGIGASAGGVQALSSLFSRMPEGHNMAFVVIIHLSQRYESKLASIIQLKTKLKVLEVQEPVKVEPDYIYVIPPGKQLEMVDGIITLSDLQRADHKNVAIDHFFRTLAKVYKNRAIGIVLSGTGNDGTLGLRLVKEQNGIAIVQDPQESEYSDMPQSAIDEEVVDFILPVKKIPDQLVELERIHKQIDWQDEKEVISEKDSNEILNNILTLVRVRTGNDFSFYKPPTLVRRITRQMQLHKLENFGAYHQLLREKPEEVDQLVDNLLINVTDFFRDKEPFEELQKKIIPEIFQNKQGKEEVRIWIPACASGEEAYSIAILIAEHLEKLYDPPTVQIFASDLSKAAITIAREGKYLKAIAMDISEERLNRFFTEEEKYYRIRMEIREMILFTEHNILGDPPFLRMDLISCRNFLIYLNQAAQDKALRLFHFALNPGRYLFLGTSESADNLSTLFSPHDKKRSIYIRNPISSGVHEPLELPSFTSWQRKTPVESTVHSTNIHSAGDIHFRLLEKLAPPSILLNSKYEILHISEHAGRYLKYSGGEPSHSLLNVLITPLRPELRALLFSVKESDKKIAKTHNIRLELEGKEVFVDLTVRAVDGMATMQGFLLILIEEQENIEKSIPSKVLEENKGKVAIREVVERLEGELANTKNRLRITVERYETLLEELKASNEELHAVNEEMRSTTEELETSKEELQSVNEELEAVNTELKEKVTEVSRINSNLQNLMTSTNIATIFLNRDLKIQLFTPASRHLFNIIDSDIGRPISHITTELEYDELEQDAQKVLTSLHVHEREVKSKKHQWFIARLLPYRTLEDKIDGVVVTFLDITDRKKAEEALTEERLKLAIEAANIGIWMYDFEKKTLQWSEVLCKMHELEREEFSGKLEQWYDFIHPDDLPRFRKFFIEDIQNRDEFVMEVRTVLSGNNVRWLYLRSSVTRDEKREAILVRGAVIDITDRLQIEKELREANDRKNEFLALLSHELRNPLTPIFAALEIMDQEHEPKESKFARDIIFRQMHHIRHLVEDLLDISRIQLGKIQLQKKHIKLKDAIDLAVEIVQPELLKQKCELDVQWPEEPVYIFADLNRIGQIVQNLLSNAIKFSEKSGHILLKITLEEKEVIISVKDDGAGIASESIKSIFELFSQANNDRTASLGGLGIGLNLAKQLAELHDGTIEVLSAGLGKGSEFIVRLPRTKERPNSNAKPQEKRKISSDQIKSKRILVVDDNQDITETLNSLLTTVGHQIKVEEDGKSAIATALSWKPQVIITDIGLPDITGYEVAGHLRSTLPDTLMIAYSGWGKEEDRKRSMESGFDHHLIKPAKIADIIRLINSEKQD